MSFPDMLICHNYNALNRGNASYWQFFKVGTTEDVFLDRLFLIMVSFPVVFRGLTIVRKLLVNRQERNLQ
jgi:hypothetical protein